MCVCFKLPELTINSPVPSKEIKSCAVFTIVPNPSLSEPCIVNFPFTVIVFLLPADSSYPFKFNLIFLFSPTTAESLVPEIIAFLNITISSSLFSTHSSNASSKKLYCLCVDAFSAIGNIAKYTVSLDVSSLIVLIGSYPSSKSDIVPDIEFVFAPSIIPS